MKSLKELSPQLVGKVNKARLYKPSKTPAASKTLDVAVKKAWLKSKVGIVKEDAPANATGPAVAGTDGNMHWSKRQPKIGAKGKIKKYGQPMVFKAIVRRKNVNESIVYYKTSNKHRG